MATGGHIKEGVQDAIFTDILQTFFNENTTAAFRNYFHALKDLCYLCYTDPDFTHMLAGNGFDGLPVPLRFDILENLFTIRRDAASHVVYHVNRHALVLQDANVEYKDKRPLLYYIQPQEQQGRVKLWMSGRTYTQMLRGSYGLEFDDSSAMVLADPMCGPRFYLSSAQYEARFSTSPKFLCTYRPTLCEFSVNTGLEHQPRVLPDEREGKYANRGPRGHVVYGLRAVPALKCPEWPEAARDWISRPRNSGWPGRQTIQQCTQLGCLLVPDYHITSEEMEDWAERQNDMDRFRSGEDEGEDETTYMQKRECDWSYCFLEPEKHLIDSFSPLQQSVLTVVCAVLENLEDFNKVFDSVHVKHCLFWLFEEQPTKSTASLTILDLTAMFFEKFCGCLRTGQMPHYFVEDWNLLLTLSEEQILDFEESLDDVRQSVRLHLLTCCHLPLGCINRYMSETGIDLQELLGGRLLPAFRSNLWAEFQENCHFVVLAGYVKTHGPAGRSYEDAMMANREVMRAISRDFPDPSDNVKVYLAMLQSHLGVLYQTKARSMILKRQRQHLMQESETCMMSSISTDGSLCRLRLANLYYHEGKYHEALEILDQVLANVHSDPWVFEDLPEDAEQLPPSQHSLFYRQLWYQWNRGLLCLDLMVGRCARGTLPTEMDRSASLSLCQVLGNAEYSAATYSAAFTASLLVALCRLRLQEPGVAKGILQRLERDAGLEGQKDMNEKRVAAYMLILGNVYLAMQMKDEAGHAYNLSLMTFPSPRNPARLCLMGMSWSRVWVQVTRGLKLVAFTALASVVLGYIQAQF